MDTAAPGKPQPAALAPGGHTPVEAAVVEAMREGVCILDAGLAVIRVNPAEARMFGCDPGELAGITLQQISAWDSADLDRKIAEVQKALDGPARCWEGEWLNRRLDGSTFATHARIVRAEGSPSANWIRISSRIGLRGTEAEMRRMVDEAPALLSRIGSDLRYRHVNRAYETWWGRSQSEFRGKHVREVLGEKAAEHVRPYLDRVLAGEPVSFEMSIARNGRTHFMMVSYTPERDENGEVQSFIALIQDVTDRVEAVRRLAELEARFSRVVDSSPFGIAIVDTAGRVLQANEALLEIFGRSFAEVSGRDFAWEAITPPEYHEMERARFAELLRAGRLIPFEKEYVRPDGSRVPVLIGAAALPGSGDVVCYVVDISEQKKAERRLRRSEERMRLAQQAARIGSWSMSPKHPERNYWSAEAYAMAGVPPDEAISHDTGMRLVHPEDRERVGTLIRHVLSGNAEDFVLRYRVGDPEGPVRWHESRGRLQRGPDGEPEGIHGITMDVTDRQEEEARREAVERQLLLLVEASGSLLALPHSSDVMHTIVRLAQQVILADGYAVWRETQSEGNLWQLSGSAGLSRDFVERAGQGVHGPFTLGPDPVIIEDVDSEPLIGIRFEALKTEGVRSLLVIPLRIGGKLSGTITFYWRRSHRSPESEVRVASALGNLAASALSTAELYERELELRAEAQAAEKRAAFLARAGAALTSSLEYEVTLASVAEMAIPDFADWAAVDVVNESGGTVRRLAVAHADPAKLELARQFNERYPRREGDLAMQAFRSGRSLLIEEIPDELLVQNAQDEDHLNLMRELGLRSLIVAPMVVNGTSLGLITFVTAESGRIYSAADLQTAEELARRAATAIEHARLYRQARESEERFLQLADNIREVFYIADHREPRMIFVSPGYERIWGRTPESLYSDPRSFLAGIHPEDRERIAAAVERQKNGEPTEEEYRVVQPGGNVRWVWDRAFPIRGRDGKVFRIAGIAEDITDRKLAAEERGRLLLREQSARQTAELLNRIGPVLAAELDQERLIQSVTDIATQIVGAQFGSLFYTVKDAAGGAAMLYTLSGAPREAFKDFPMVRATKLFAPTFVDKQVIRSDDIVRDPRYGKNAPYNGMPKGHLPVRSYLAVPVVSRSGEVLGGLFFGHGETGRFSEQHEQIVVGIAAQAAIALDNARLFADSQKAREALVQSNEELRRVNADLEQFAYSASHDLKEPLRMVAIYSQMMQRKYSGKLDPQADEYLSYAAEGARRMEALVADLLAYTQAVNLSNGEEVQPVAAGEVLNEAISNLKGIIAESGAVIRRGALPRLMVSEVHLLQLFQNVIGNALKYRAERNPVIHVTATQQGSMWRICVEDNGIGIAPQYAEQVFGLFKRLHTSDRYSGTGIGLAICQKIVLRYGGRIWVDSEGPGRGSRFCFTLPGTGGDEGGHTADADSAG